MTSTTRLTTAHPVVSVENLTKAYGAHVAVDDLTFEVRSGEVTGLLGPNGAGKTTAMKMLLGLVQPTSGRSALLGIKQNSSEFSKAVRQVGALIEAPAIYERLSARENLRLQAMTLGVKADAKRLDELLDLVDLSSRAGDNARTYSLGMKQRLGIAVALIGRPELVVLDEPANGLDPAGIVEIRNLLRRLPELGTTVLVSSHQLAEVQQACDRLVVLDHGRLITSGTTEEILDGYRSHDMTIRFAPELMTAAVDFMHDHTVPVVSGTQDSLTVTLPSHWSGRNLNQRLVGAGIFADEIFRQNISLESAFLEMTGANHGNR